MRLGHGPQRAYQEVVAASQAVVHLAYPVAGAAFQVGSSSSLSEAASTVGVWVKFTAPN